MKKFKILILFLLIVTPYCVKAEIKTQNFDDYVKEERRREIAEEKLEKEVNTFLKKRQAAQTVGNVVVILFTIVWLAFFYYVNKKYFLPHDITDTDEAFKIESLSPIEVSAVINKRAFSEYDLVMTLFDLIRKKRLVIKDIDDDIKIYENTEVKDTEADEGNYEDFFIRWFFHKIGEKEYFSINRLKRYLELDSHGVEFGIDYDIWSEEINESVDLEILDEETEKWKRVCTITGLIYSLLGIIILYMTNSVFSIALFGITFLSFRLTDNRVRRTQAAQKLYKSLQEYKNNINYDVEYNVENVQTIDADFVYSIPLNNIDAVFEKCSVYEKLFYDAIATIAYGISLADELVGQSSLNKLK